MKFKFTLRAIALVCLMLTGFGKLQAQTCGSGFYYSVSGNGVVTFVDTSWAFNQITYYMWDFGDGMTGTTQNATHTYTANGLYTVCHIIGNAGCADTVCQTIAVTIGCNMTVVVNYSQPNQSLYPTITGGNQPFTYNWSNGATTQMINPTTAGNYCVTVADAMGCTATACYNFIPGCNLVATVFEDTTNNSLNAIVTNGTSPYSYLWNNGGSTLSTIYPTSAGNYCVTVTDAQGCTAMACYSFGSAPCSPPSGISYLIDSTGTTATISWNAPALQPISYEFAVTTLSTPPGAGTAFVGTSTSVSSLTPNTNYCLHVRSSCGPGIFSNWQTTCFTTTPGAGCNYVFTQTWQSPGQLLFISSATAGQTIIWNFGDGTPEDTTQSSQVSHTFMNGGMYNVCMTVAGCVTYCNNVYTQGFPTSVICGNIFNDNNGNSIIDSTDTGFTGAYLYIFGNSVQQTLLTDSFGNYSYSVPAGTYTVQMCASGLSLGGIITVPAPLPTSACASYTFTIGAYDTLCGYNFGIFNNASTVSGYLYFDANSNGIKDSTEVGIAYQNIMIGGYSAYTNASGYYSLMVPMGTYTITYTPAGFYSSGTITTSNVTVSVTQNGTSYSNNNVGLYMTPGQVDLGISLYPSTTVTPGFGSWYSIHVCNYGTTPTGATVTMMYDPVLTPNYQSPVASNVDPVNHIITWNVASISPGACSYTWVTFTTQTGLALGTLTTEFAAVTPTIGIDNNIGNNIDTVHQTVVGSWDPNNKLVDKTNTTDVAYQLVSSANPDQEIEYTINFQNSGNAPAVNVVVVDEMSGNLDMNTYQFIGSSHNCVVMRNGYTTTYKFMNIMLPDSVNNEPQSHGFVSYKVSALNNLNTGEMIVDYANIYFDFNAAVATNDAAVTMVGPTAIPSLLSNTQLIVYPNPAHEFVSINLQSRTEGTAYLNVTDIAGKTCLKLERELKTGINKLILNTGSLSKGIYMLQVIAPDGTVKTTKLNISE